MSFPAQERGEPDDHGKKAGRLLVLDEPGISHCEPEKLHEHQHSGIDQAMKQIPAGSAAAEEKKNIADAPGRRGKAQRQ